MISVIIPCHNCEDYIGKAIESVLKQTVKTDIEILVIDDASTDHSRQVVSSYMNQTANLESGEYIRSISLHSNGKNLGVAKTRNVGIKAASGEWIAFLDADDWWTADKLEKQFSLILEKDSVLVYSGRELMNNDGSSMNKVIGVPKKASYNSLLRTNYIPCSSVLMKTEVAREFYMSHDELHEDYILWLKVLKKYKTAYGINEPLLKSRMSKGGKSRNKWKSAKMHYGVYKYMGVPRVKAMGLFVSYAIHGVKKYR